MPLILPIIASLFEVIWALSLKFTDGFTRFWPTIGALAALFVSVFLLGLAARSQPIGAAYAVWTEIGAVGAVVCGMAICGDPASAMQLICVGLILAGVIGLKIV